MKDLTKPWKVCLNMPSAAIPGHIIKIDDDVQLPIASIWEGGGSQGKQFFLRVAYLISAAPELLAALKTALPILNDKAEKALENANAAKIAIRTASSRSHAISLQQNARLWMSLAKRYKADADAARLAITKALGPSANNSEPRQTTAGKRKLARKP